VTIVLLIMGVAPVHAAAPEYQVKAAMLANFALFVNWPAAAFPAAWAPFVTCVVGEDPFGPWLKTEMGERVGSHPVQIRQVEKADKGAGCHLVYVSRSEQTRLAQVLAALKGSHALIVSDVNQSQDFCRQGGTIALFQEGGKVRFELNADAAAKAGLGIDSKIKRVARSTSCGGD